MTAAIALPFEIGQWVTIAEALRELLAGKPGRFLGIDPFGYLEIEFAVKPKRPRTIFVLDAVVRPYEADG